VAPLSPFHGALEHKHWVELDTTASRENLPGTHGSQPVEFALYVPLGHSEHSVVIGSGAIVPVVHERHVEEPAGAYRPGGQVPHVGPVSSLSHTSGPHWHIEALEVTASREKRPPGHGTQCVVFALYVPLAHTEHSCAIGLGATVPVEQEVHMVTEPSE